MVKRDESLKGLIDGGVLRPLLEVNPCGFCSSPRGDRTRSYYCRGCQEHRASHGRVLDSFEPIAFSGDQERLLGYVREWKRWAGLPLSAGHRRVVETHGLPLAAMLSAYLEAHCAELGLDGPSTVVTYVPTTSDVISRCAELAGDRGWYTPELAELGSGDDPRHARFLSGDERAGRSSDSWTITADVGGAGVVLLDDVYTTGGSFHSFAAALKNEGATQVRAVALVRTTLGNVYQQSLEYRQRSEELRWSADVRFLGTWY